MAAAPLDIIAVTTECDAATAKLGSYQTAMPPLRLLKPPPYVPPSDLTGSALALDQMQRLVSLMGNRSPEAYLRAVREQTEVLVAEIQTISRLEDATAYEAGMRLKVLRNRKPAGVSFGTYLKDLGVPLGRRRADEYISVFEGRTTVLEIQEKKRESMARTRAHQAQRGAKPTVETKGDSGSACAINWENHREDDTETDAIVRARAAKWQLHEALRLAEEFALRRPGTTRAEIKPAVVRQIEKVHRAWKRLHREMLTKGGAHGAK